MTFLIRQKTQKISNVIKSFIKCLLGISRSIWTRTYLLKSESLVWHNFHTHHFIVSVCVYVCASACGCACVCVCFVWVWAYAAEICEQIVCVPPSQTCTLKAELPQPKTRVPHYNICSPLCVSLSVEFSASLSSPLFIDAIVALWYYWNAVLIGFDVWCDGLCESKSNSYSFILLNVLWPKPNKLVDAMALMWLSDK